MILCLSVTLATLLSLVTVAFASPSKYGGSRCGTQLTAEDIEAKESDFTEALSRIDIPTRIASDFSDRTIPVHFHVIYAGKELKKGYVPDNQIEDQIEVLNRDYTGTGLKFNLVNTTRIENAEWFEKVGPKTPEQIAMKKRLRSGGPDILNVFTVSFDSRHGLLGYATLPSDYRNNPGDDGVVIRYSTLPGSILSPMNLGRTLTHEVGHWVGLYHTFEGGCYGSGDYVSDTPSEAVPASGCPGKRDTCESEGFDPVFNFMDYTDDSCMDNFTRGQAVRLRNQIHTYRKIPL